MPLPSTGPHDPHVAHEASKRRFDGAVRDVELIAEEPEAHVRAPELGADDGDLHAGGTGVRRARRAADDLTTVPGAQFDAREEDAGEAVHVAVERDPKPHRVTRVCGPLRRLCVAVGKLSGDGRRLRYHYQLQIVAGVAWIVRLNEITHISDGGRTLETEVAPIYPLAYMWLTRSVVVFGVMRCVAPSPSLEGLARGGLARSPEAVEAIPTHEGTRSLAMTGANPITRIARALPRERGQCRKSL